MTTTLGRNELHAGLRAASTTARKCDADGNLITNGWGHASTITYNGTDYADIVMYLFSDGSGGFVWGEFGERCKILTLIFWCNIVFYLNFI